MTSQDRNTGSPRDHRFSRRSFVKSVGAGWLAAGLTHWMPRAFAQTGSGSIAPLFPGATATSTQYAGLPFASATAIQTLLAYDPTIDPDARYFRSRVPIGARIPTFAATQARPNLDSRPLSANYSQYYEGVLPSDTAQFQYSRYGTSNNVFLPRFQQYHDIVGGWQGAQGLPTTAYTDTCHRNGALSVGIVFQPYFSSNSSSFVYQAADGSFPVGNKLVDLAQYFGFDGYLLNVELSLTTQQVSALMAMFNAMQARARSLGLPAFHLQWYDAVTTSGSLAYQNQLDSQNMGWITNGGCNSMFINYAWGQNQVTTTTATAQSQALNPFTSAYFGLLTEGRNQIGLSVSPSEGGGNNANNIPLVIPTGGSGAPKGSIALFDPSRQTVYLAQQALGSSATAPALLATAQAYDRQFWSGASSNPGAPYASTPQNPYGGVSDYIAERSVIGAFPFLCRFNVGSGDQFFVGGRAASTTAWFNMGVQDILPTWQWWVKNFNDANIGSGLLGADYDFSTAYNGGSSLRIAGQLGPANPTELRLFKTRLLVGTSGSYVLNVTYLLGQSGNSNLYIGLTFQDGPSNVIWIAAPAGTARGSTGWLQTSINLGAYAGRTIAAISLGFQVPGTVTTASAYAINIGEIALLGASSPILPGVPAGFALEKSLIASNGASAQLRLYWTYDPAVWYYDIYRQPSGGGTQNMIWLGRISCDAYFVSSMARIGSESAATLQLVSVSADGNETTASSATLVFPWTAATADFSLAASPTSLSLAQGRNASSTISVSALNGFGGSVSLAASGLPSGVTAAFSPSSTTGTSTLTLTASSSATAGTYTVTVTGTSGALVHSNSFSLTVLAADFSLSASRSSPSIKQGSNGTMTITVNPLNGFNGAVSLAASGLPAGVSAAFTPSSTTGTSTLTLTASGTATTGTYAVTVTGTAGTLTHSTVISLSVTAASGTSTIINDNNSGIVYSGGFSYGANRGLGDYNNDVHFTTANGAYASYTFTGTRIDFLSEMYVDEGLIDVYIDGVLQTTVNAYNATRLAQQVLYTASWSTAGTHTIKLVKKSGTYMLIDAFRVYS